MAPLVAARPQQIQNFILPKIHPVCAINLSAGALSSLSKTSYETLMLDGFEKCGALQDAAESLSSMSFNFDDGSFEEVKANYIKLSDLFRQLVPAWEECDTIREALSAEEYQRVDDILRLLAEPGTTDMVRVLKHAFNNWQNVRSKAEAGRVQIKRNNCASAGQIYGRILLDSLEDDTNLLRVVMGRTHELV